MPAIYVLFCIPWVPMRIFFDSPATPALPISMLLLPVVRAPPAPIPTPMLLLPRLLLKKALRPQAVLLLPVVLLKSATVTVRRVEYAGGEVEERVFPLSRVAVGIASVGWWTHRLRERRKRQPCQAEGKRDEKNTAYNPHCLGTWQLLC